MDDNLKFFTNEPEKDLYGKFQTLLRGDTNFFDVIVGYFRTSGFFLMCDALESVKKIRILVGLNVDKTTAQLFTTIKVAKENFSTSVKDEFDNSDVTYDIERGVKKFLEWLASGKLELRLYTEAPLHAKVRQRHNRLKQLFQGGANQQFGIQRRAERLCRCEIRPR